MTCEHCGAALPPVAQFCGRCGRSVGVSAPPASPAPCPVCATVPFPGDRYCGECGTRLGMPIDAPPPAIVREPEPEPEPEPASLTARRRGGMWRPSGPGSQSWRFPPRPAAGWTAGWRPCIGSGESIRKRAGYSGGIGFSCYCNMTVVQHCFRLLLINNACLVDHNNSSGSIRQQQFGNSDSGSAGSIDYDAAVG